MDTTTGRMATIRLNHYSTWLYGDNYLFRGTVSVAISWLASRHWRTCTGGGAPTFSSTSCSASKATSWGSSGTADFAAQVNQSGNGFYAYLAGVGGNFALPRRHRLALNLFLSTRPL